ncbi:MAG: AAA family ATPase, partial [Rhodospirillales bacterium]|nr:AAA family ATPase [Rhodospirillales bacterium]
MTGTGLWHRFGLTASPFETAPPAAPWIAEPLRQPFEDLRAAIDRRAALVLLAGEPGSGRTTLARAAIAASARATAAAWLPTAQTDSPAALARWLLERFGGEAAAAGDADPRRLLQQRIAARGALAAAPLIVIDDLEELPPAVLNDLMRLLAAAASATPPLSVLMISEPPLRHDVAKLAHAILAAAPLAAVTLPALTVEATAAYVAHRLASAGYAGPQPFTADALIRIANLSRGRPLHINRLCEACFDGASPNSLPLGSDVVAAALANSLSASTAHDGGEASPASGPAARSSAAVEDEDARLERLAGRVNAVIHRSFAARAAEPAAAPPAPAAPPPASPAPAAPAPPTPRPPAGRRRRRPLFARALMVLIGIAGAAAGWRLVVGDWPWPQQRQPAPMAALTEAARPDPAPPA